MNQNTVIANRSDGEAKTRASVWGFRVAAFMFLAVVSGTVWTTNNLLTKRFTETTRNEAELRLALYSGNLLGELRSYETLPLILARDETLVAALDSGDFSQTSQRLISLVQEMGAASLTLLDAEGRIVAASNRFSLGSNHRGEAYFVEAARAQGTVFAVVGQKSGGYRFMYSRRIHRGFDLLGVVAVEVNLRKFETAWRGIVDAILVEDSKGYVILATEPRWRGLSESEALGRRDPETAIRRAFRATRQWATSSADALVPGEGGIRLETRLPFRGWRMVLFTTYASVRQKVNGIIALEFMAFAVLLAAALYMRNRRTARGLRILRHESAELRHLNARLQREVAERKRVQRTLSVAEQSLAQSSKLAALGEMSAAVSHELNQPLAAMKTYLAGARLLLARNQLHEARESIGRIDALIERMGAITRQLKSFARKASEELGPVDLGAALEGALSLMELQFRQSNARLVRIMPNETVMVLGDQVRIEQVVVNLLRNALDATKSAPEPEIEIILAVGETATLAVRDNGAGIRDFTNLFEPFHTTKKAGDGIGLGLAISSGIVADLGGRMEAHNGENGGAVFEVQLPLLGSGVQAA